MTEEREKDLKWLNTLNYYHGHHGHERSLEEGTDSVGKVTGQETDGVILDMLRTPVLLWRQPSHIWVQLLGMAVMVMLLYT